MTIQTKQYIDLTDIVTFRFDCKQCGAILSLPISDQRSKLAVDCCPNCKAEWTLRQGGSHLETLLEFRQALRNMQAIMAKDYPNPLEFTVTLEVRLESALRLPAS